MRATFCFVAADERVGESRVRMAIKCLRDGLGAYGIVIIVSRLEDHLSDDLFYSI